MNYYNGDDPNIHHELGDLLPADVLKKLTELLELLHWADNTHHGSNVINIYSSGSQHIDHVDTVNFRMDGNGEFHFGMVENVQKKRAGSGDEGVQSVEERVRYCIVTLKKENMLRHLYDYTWIMEVMNQTSGMPHFDAPSSFISYLKDLDIESRLPSGDTINKKQNVFTGTFPEWQFTDCDTTEANRRINVGKRFLNIYRNI